MDRNEARKDDQEAPQVPPGAVTNGKRKDRTRRPFGGCTECFIAARHEAAQPKELQIRSGWTCCGCGSHHRGSGRGGGDLGSLMMRMIR